MTLPISAADAIRAAGALLSFALGLVVLRLGPRRPVNVAFAVYAVSEGLRETLDVDAVFVLIGETARGILHAHLFLVVVLALAGLALLYPRPLPRSQWRVALIPPVVLGLASLAVQHLSLPWGWDGNSPYLIALNVLAVGMPGFGALMPSRFAAVRGMMPDARQIARLAVLFIIMNGIGTGAYLALVARASLSFEATASFLSFAIVAPASLWLWATSRCTDAAASRTARNVALAVVGVPLAVMLIVSLGPQMPMNAFHGILGLARVVFVFALAYGIVRHDVLGLDVKIRWGVSRGTIAAIFIAVFFVASEGAQIVFGQGNEWFGLLVAGFLVFALAPLQRAAERLAEKAVPSSPSHAAAPRQGVGESSFRKAVWLALRDSALTREEEGHLHELARDLGLDGARAHAIIAEIEREASS